MRLPSPLDWPLRRSYALAARAYLRLRRGQAYDVTALPGLTVTVCPEVFDPVLFRTGPVLAQAVEADVRPGLSVLDLGCGTGIVGLAAARAGARVLSVDLNPAAVACATNNARRHALPVAVRHSDLFGSVPERFDRIAFNPPFFRGTPEAGFDQAWRAEHVFERFAAEVRDHLTPDGAALVLHSDHGACDELTALLGRSGRCEVVVEHTWLTERVRVERWTW